jgi:hypothetical protein
MHRGYAIYQTSHIYFHAYLDEYRDGADRIGAFLARREIETAFFKVEDPRLQKLLSDATYVS